MIIKPFQIADLGAFIPNEFSCPDEIFPMFLDARYEVSTMWGDDGLVQAIICLRNYWGRCWSAFVLISKNFLKANHLVLKALINEQMIKHNAQRLQTESLACDELRKWHEFLGFKLEGTKVKMMFDRDYDCWAIVPEGV